jgi:hypothetical protein
MSEYSTATFTSSSPFISSVKAHFPLKSFSINDFLTQLFHSCLPNQKFVLFHLI